MPPAVIELDFDPIVRVGDLAARLETVGVAAAILLGLVLAALIALRTPADPGDGSTASAGEFRGRLRPDDLLFIVLGVVPGALVGGRLGHALVHLEYYAVHPSALVDPAVGSLELGMAVVGGTLTGAAVARLLDGTTGAWLRVAAAPLLVAIALGKLALALGGRGQGLPSEAPWGTAYVGAGPWASLAPATPSHPAQVYEAGAALVALVVLGLLHFAGVFRRVDAQPFFLGVAVWAAGRALVAATWRDPAVLGPLNAPQAIALVLAVSAVLALVAQRLPQRSGAGGGSIVWRRSR